MSAVDDLREAAELMRQRADRATTGPWHADPSEIRGEHAGIWVAESLNGDLPDAGEANSIYIASMHPLVAFAIVDWLVAHARDLESAGGHLSFCDSPGDTGRALVVARIYLGRSS